MAQLKSLVLLPAPRQWQIRVGYCKLESGKRIALLGAPANELLFSGQCLQDALREHTPIDWTLAATAKGAREEMGAMLRTYLKGALYFFTQGSLKLHAPFTDNLFRKCYPLDGGI